MPLQHVKLQIAFLITRIGTEVTFEWLCPSVNPKMFSKISFLTTYKRTEIALEWLFPSVYPKMDFHVSNRLADLPTSTPRANIARTGALQKTEQMRQEVTCSRTKSYAKVDLRSIIYER
jgi:hypothetical protein